MKEGLPAASHVAYRTAWSHKPALREGLGLACLLAAGLLPRLAFVTAFPTRPVSDFRGLLEFGLWMRDHSVTAGGFFWDLFSPGLPLVLSLILRVFPESPETAARFSTAVATGLVPVFPFAIWRGVLPLWVRFLAGAMLAVWPGQVIFSGVVAQDNWVLLPAVALGALATRSLITPDRSSPVAAGLLYALGAAMRQEMLIVLFPLLLTGAGFASRQGRRWRRVAGCALAASLPLLLLAAQRQAATGRFALTSEHFGMTILGTYVPGATANGWTNPIPYVASVEPALLNDLPELRRRATGLAVREALRRPAFHAARILALTGNLLIASEAGNFYWCLLAPEALPPARQALAGAFTARAVPLLRTELAILQALFFAAVLLTLRNNRAVQVLCVAIVLKIALHAVVVPLGRFFLAVTMLQMLVIALGCWEVASRRSFRPAAAALAAGGITAAALFFLAPRAVAWVQARDVDGQRSYRFRLSPFPGEPKVLDCRVDRGRLTGASETGASIETFHPNPPPGETAAVACVAAASPPLPPLVIRLLDPYAPGGLPGRMVQRMRVDGREVLVHDVAGEPGSGWSEVPLGRLGQGKETTVVIEISGAAGTTFELAGAKKP